MATGGAVVCTDAHGNRDFCVDGENCLMPDPTVQAVSAAIAKLLADPELRERLGDAGRRTAAGYSWEIRIDALEAYLQRLAGADGGDVQPRPAEAQRQSRPA
jgi:glycosyltransferase involved in cell wall biosynthesis